MRLPPASLLQPVRSIFRALATTVVPDAAMLDAHEWGDLERIVEDALATRPPKMQRQVVMFLRLVQLVPAERYGLPFTRLTPARRAAFVAGLERSRLHMIRRGFWGVRTLILMGYYGRPEAAAMIGYRAHPDGWAHRGGTASLVPLVADSPWIEPSA